MNSWTVRLTVITPDFANSRKPASSASDIDKEIKENIILTCTSSSLRRRALGENPTLEALLKLGRALELSAKQAKDEEATGNDSVNKINTKEDDRQSRRCNRTDDSSQSRRNHSPSRNRHYGDQQANLHENVAIVVDMLLKKIHAQRKGKLATHAEKNSHFAHVCKSKPRTVGSVETDEISDEEYEYAYNVSHQDNRKPPICQPQINSKSVEMMIESGASVNVLDEITFARIKSLENGSLRPTHTKIYFYGSEIPLSLLGILNATVKSSYASTSAQLLVVKGEN